MASEWTAEAATFPVPLEVDGMVAALSHLKGVEVQVDAGVVRLVLKNYTGVCTINLENSQSRSCLRFRPESYSHVINFYLAL